MSTENEKTTDARAWPGLRARWRQLTTPLPPDNPDAARFRSLQLQPLLALTPWLIACTGINALVTCWVFRDTHWFPAALAWGLAAVGTSLVSRRGWRSWRRGEWPSHCSARTTTRAERNAALTALIWSLPMLAGYGLAGSETQRTVLLLVTEGTICVGTFALASLPRAAVYYALVMTAATLLGLARAGWPDGAVLPVLATTYVAAVLVVALKLSRHLGARLEAEALSIRQRQLAELMLDEFTQLARDWPWELDAQGRLCRVSPRLAEQLGRRPVQLEGEELPRLISLTLPRPNFEQRQALDALEEALHDAAPFSGLQVPVMVAGKLRWWALSGKRLVDERGRWRGWRGVGSDVTGDRQFADEQARLSSHDSLTGLANAEQLQRRLESYGERPFTLLCLDLCDFAEINQAFGQLVGDQVLQIVASRFRACVRQGDLLVRLQGDRFVLVSWGTLPESAATSAARRLLDTLRQPCTVDGTLVPVAACVGILQVNPPADPLPQLLERAGLALESARQQGAGCLAFWHDDPTPPAAAQDVSGQTPS